MKTKIQSYNRLFELERQILQPHVRADVLRLELLLAPDFFEFGSSGKIWTRAEVLQALPQEARAQESGTEKSETKNSIGQPSVWEATNFAGHTLSDDCVLVTYRTTRKIDGQIHTALRSSIWRNSKQGWQMFFHQGTPVPTTVATP